MDGHPLPRERKSATLAWLRQMREADEAQQIVLRVCRRGFRGMSLRELVAETGLSREALQASVAGLLRGPLIGSSGGPQGSGAEYLLSREALGRAMELLLQEIGRTRAGSAARAELLSRTRWQSWVFDLALRTLEEQGRIVAERDHLSLPGRSGAPEAHGAEVERIYAAAGLASPIASEVAAKLGLAAGELHGTLTFLLRGKRLVRLGADNLLVHSEALARLIAELRQHRGESFDVARFKGFTGLTRKHAIPLLECLDGARITRNSNGVRIVL